MIHLIDVAKTYYTRFGAKHVLRPTRLSLPAHRRIGVLGRNGAGKSTLLNLIAGVEEPDQGMIVRTCRISWPLGFQGGVHNDLTGAENVAFAARIHGGDPEEAISFVTGFSELGDNLRLPVRTYSAGMRARLAFGMSMAMDFDCYLVDEITGVGDRAFQEKCRQAFLARSERSGILFVSHSERTIQQYCDCAIVIDDGHLVPFEDMGEAVAYYLATSK